MTRILIISDIHGNHPALAEFMRTVENSGEINTIRCLGDVVGYYMDPVPAWEWALKHDPEMRVGNHEVAVVEDACGDDLYLDRRAVMAACRHRAILRKKQDHWKSLRDSVANHSRHEVRRESVDGYHLHFVHGTPIGHNYISLAAQATYLYPDRALPDWEPIGHYLGNANGGHDKSILFFGHTHLPTFFHYVGAGPTFEGATYNTQIEIRAQRRIAVNPGSIGAPRDGVIYDDGRKRAHGVILDTVRHTIEFVSVPYNPIHIYLFGREDYCEPFDRDDLRNVCLALVKRRMVSPDCLNAITAGLEDPNTDTQDCLNKLWKEVQGQLLEYYFNKPCRSDLVYEYAADGFRVR